MELNRPTSMSPIETLDFIDVHLIKQFPIKYIRFSHGEINQICGKGARMYDYINGTEKLLVEALNINDAFFLRGINNLHKIDENMGPGVFADGKKWELAAEQLVNNHVKEENRPHKFHSGVAFQYMTVFGTDHLRSFLKRHVKDNEKKVAFIGSIDGDKMEDALGCELEYIEVEYRNAHRDPVRHLKTLIDKIENSDVGLVLSSAGCLTGILALGLYKAEIDIPLLDIGSASNAWTGKGNWAWIPEGFKWEPI